MTVYSIHLNFDDFTFRRGSGGGGRLGVLRGPGDSPSKLVFEKIIRMNVPIRGYTVTSYNCRPRQNMINTSIRVGSSASKRDGPKFGQNSQNLKNINDCI